MSSPVPYEVLGEIFERYEALYNEALASEGEDESVLMFEISILKDNDPESFEYRIGGNRGNLMNVAFTHSFNHHESEDDEEESLEELLPALRILNKIHEDIQAELQRFDESIRVSVNAVTGKRVEVRRKVRFSNLNAVAASCCRQQDQNGRWYWAKRLSQSGSRGCGTRRC